MASQGERVPGVDMCGTNLEAMVQDEIPMQDIQEQELPQLNPEPEMAAAHGAPPSPLRQSPSPLPSETATDRGDSASSDAAEFCRVGEMLMRMMQGMKEEINKNMDGMNEKMETNTNEIKNEMEKKMDAHTQTLREEMQQMG